VKRDATRKCRGVSPRFAAVSLGTTLLEISSRSEGECDGTEPAVQHADESLCPGVSALGTGVGEAPTSELSVFDVVYLNTLAGRGAVGRRIAANPGQGSGAAAPTCLGSEESVGPGRDGPRRAAGVVGVGAVSRGTKKRRGYRGAGSSGRC